MYKKQALLLVGFFFTAALFAFPRSFDDVFPDCDAAEREQIFASGGLLKTGKKPDALQLLPPALVNMNIEQPVLKRNLSFMVESLMVIPGMQNPVDMLKVYNALGKVRDLKGRLYRSHTRNREVPLFEDASRLESDRKLSRIPDPPAAQSVPDEQAMFICLKDANFGNSFYRAEITFRQPGLIYSLSNFKDLTYLFVPVIKKDKFIAQLYIEPLLDGILIYSIAGADVSDFMASAIDIPSAVQKRLEVIIGWVIDGIR